MSEPTITARAPAKLIISGEHSVLYGQPALAMAVNSYIQTTINSRDTQHIYFNLANLAYAKSFTYKALRRLARNLQREYNNFLSGNCGIRSVLKRPFELLQYSVSNLFEYLNLQLSSGVEISVDSSIPIGCGMGSSAAAVISTIYSLNHFLAVQWQPEDYLNFSKQIENLQHGKSSGLDLHLVTYGGCARFENNVASARPIPTVPLYLINTGTPASTTGECVTKVAEIFKQDVALAKEFGMLTNAIDAALSSNNIVTLKQGIRANHQLLDRIGVVPEKVANLIQDIELHGGAAKICGAGAIAGDNGGAVLLCAEDNLQAVVSKHGYSIQTIQVDTHGTRII